MGTYDDIMEIENGEAEQLDHFKAVQRQINAGTVWRLQGSFGRAAMDYIEAGFVMTGKEARRDYWGNSIPARSDLKAGTKGTYDYVAKAMGVEWADAMEAE